MTDKPEIVHCGGLVFIFMYFQSRWGLGDGNCLLPAWEDQQRLGVEVELRTDWGESYFVVSFKQLREDGKPYPTADEWDEKVRQVMQQIWSELRKRDIVDCELPEIQDGLPHLMTRQWNADKLHPYERS